MSLFKLVSDLKPEGDQPQAIEALAKGLEAGSREQVLVGVTGSGKTFTMANERKKKDRSRFSSFSNSFFNGLVPARMRKDFYGKMEFIELI